MSSHTNLFIKIQDKDIQVFTSIYYELSELGLITTHKVRSYNRLHQSICGIGYNLESAVSNLLENIESDTDLDWVKGL